MLAKCALPTPRLSVILLAVLAYSLFAGPFVLAKTKIPGEVRISKENGLASAIFRTPSGGKVTAFLPLNVGQNEDEIGGTVERQQAQQPNSTPQQSADAAAEISGVVTIEPATKHSKSPPINCPPDKPGFTCSVPDDCKYLVSYKPPGGPSCTAIVECQPSSTALSDRCGIPQLTSCGGNIHVSMPCQNGDPSDNTCDMGGKPSPCRAWSSEGCVFHVPPASELPPGPCPVAVSRGDDLAVGQTHVAQVKMTIAPNNLKSGQPCQVATSVFCPGLQDVENGALVIKNYNPAVLNMPSKVVPITSFRSATFPGTSGLGGENMTGSSSSWLTNIVPSGDKKDCPTPAPLPKPAESWMSPGN